MTDVKSERFRILDTQWHVGHAYEMLKFPFVEWTWLHQFVRRPYSHVIRGDLSGMFSYAHYYEAGKYDAALLHLDQECLTPSSWSRGKGVIYRDLNEVIQDIPKIVLMHGTPHFPEAPYPYSDVEWLVYRLREVVGTNHLVVNSYQAAEQWGFGSPIIHGMDQGEWLSLPKQPRVVTTLSPGGMASYYDRAFLAAVRARLEAIDIKLCHVGVDYTPASWEEYKGFLGGSLLYFNPTKESPMPRARTEAMFSGCCVVTTPSHDADSFIETGYNGFLIPRDAEYVAELLSSLLSTPQKTAAIGLRGRHTAIDRFSWARFSADWFSLLSSIVGTAKREGPCQTFMKHG